MIEAAREVEAIEIRLFLEAIHARYGYDMRDYAGASIRRRVLAALMKSGFRNLGELQHAVLADPSLFGTVLEDLTVRVTEMFRDPLFYRTFREQVIPVLRTYPLIRVWHSGCSSGEEVYACAILLTEAGLYDRCQIYATDMSPQAIEQAKQGIYPDDQLKTFTENYERVGGARDLSHYYTAAYGGFALNDALRRNILFFQHNLVSDHTFGEMHVIFCRNVLIYFGRDLRDRVLERLTHSLVPGGFLCLGSSERLPQFLQEKVFSGFSGEHRIYRYEI